MQIADKPVGTKVIVIYQKPNGAHSAEIHENNESADRAVDRWTGCWEEVCRLPDIDEKEFALAKGFLNIIDHWGKEPRMKDVLQAWFTARLAAAK